MADFVNDNLPSVPGAYYNLETQDISLRTAIQGGQYHGLVSTNAAVGSAGNAIRRYWDGRNQYSTEGNGYKGYPDEHPNIYDVRDFATGMFAGNATQDTAGLVAAAAAISSASDSSAAKPGVVKFPRGNLLLNTPLTIYGSSGSASAWIGRTGRSRGPDGTSITWAGGNSMSPMLHLLGMNASLIQDIAFNAEQDATHLARFCVWAETNQRNSGAGSSGMKFKDCWFTGWGNMGAGLVIGDEVRTTLTINTLVGNFVVGEQILSTSVSDGIATVLTWDGVNQLKIGQLMGYSFTTGGTTIVGMTSGATAAIVSTAIDGAYLGNLQCSELVVDHCGFQGTEITDTTDKRAGWAGIAMFGSNNNKNYTVRNGLFDGSRYGIDTGIGGSGFFDVSNPSGSDIGHNGKGFLARFGGGQVTWKGGDFENGAAGFKGGVFNLGAGGTMAVDAGEFYGLMPSDNYAIKNSGVMHLRGVHLGADVGNAQIQTNDAGSLICEEVGWRENFTGYLPVFDSSDNPLGLSGTADNSRNADRNFIARGCLSNITGNANILPDIYLKPLSPARTQLHDDGITNITVVKRGTLSTSAETRTMMFTHVKAQSGSDDIALTPPKAIIRGIILDLTTVFLGGALSAVTMSVGIDSNHTKYMGAQDVYTATGQFTTFTHVLAPWAGDYLKAFFTFTGDTVNHLTQGSVDIYVLYEKL